MLYSIDIQYTYHIHVVLNGQVVEDVTSTDWDSAFSGWMLRQ